MTIVDELFLILSKDGPRVINLDEVGEAVGARFVTPEDIERLIGRLEAAGSKLVAFEGLALLPALMKVLAAARELRARGEKSGVDEIARLVGQTPREVRVALLYGEVLSRGKPA